MISKEEVNHISKLARLGLNDKELDKLKGELSKVLDYIDKLKEVNVDGIEATSHSVLIENITRGDQVDENSKMHNETFLELVPEEQKGYLKVKSILK